MNYVQFSLFILYLLSVFISGIGIYTFVNKSEVRLNKIVCIGESLLLGSIFIIGQLFILSLLHLYKNPYLWGIVFLNYAFILNSHTRKMIREISNVSLKLDIPITIFFILAGILIFRNMYFLIDVDSLSTYLFTQRLWLESGTSLIGNATSDIRIFTVQFDAIPYALGISVFGQETLFPQLVNLLWRVIAVLLVFGYTRYRLNGYYALAAAAFMIFNDHFFYSGANQWVIINAAVITLIFAAVYNFWEARAKNDVVHLVFALIFLSQLMANKYYLFFVFVFLFLMGVLIQNEPVRKLKVILKERKYLFVLLAALILMLLWYLKNFIVTGDPAFPLLSGKLHIFGWTQEQQKVFAQLVGGISSLKFFKFISFLFIWPGINPAKYVLISLIILPFIILVYSIREKTEKDSIAELSYWLGACVLTLFGLCLATWQDPRIYRFLIGLYSFTAVFSLRSIIKGILGVKNEWLTVSIILLLSLQGYSIINQGGVIINRPTLKENIGVVLNKIHMDYILRKHHPEVYIALEGLGVNQDKIGNSAWALPDNSNAFFLPDRPVISLLRSTTIRWDSYSRKELVVDDLKKNGIDWIMIYRSNKLIFMPVEGFAGEAIKADRFPKKTYYDYGFPEELTRIN